MNFKEIVDKIIELSGDKYRQTFAYGRLEESTFGKIETVNREGGEGQGEYWNVVKHFVDHNVYISLNGYYTSYEGTDFNQYDLKEVFPQEKTIVVYSEKK